MINFSLYLQTSYSFNGSLLDIEKTVKVAKEMGYKTLGLTDFNKMHGIIKFYKTCLNHGIKPLLGLEVLVKSEKYSDMIMLLYAKDNQGYQNLMKLSSCLATTDGYLELHNIHKYNEGLIIVPVIDRGGFFQIIKNGSTSVLEDLLLDLDKSINHYYLGFSSHLFIDTDLYNNLSKDWKLVLVNPVKYLKKEDKEASDVLKKILAYDEEGKGIFEEDKIDFYLPSLKEVDEKYKQYPDIIKNTFKLIDSCNVLIDFKQKHLPMYPLEEETSLNKLRKLSNKGLVRRLKQKGVYQTLYNMYIERLDHELKIIENMQYEDYFLIVWDFVLYAKKQGILVGPGRGSAAGSLISYALGITEVDPIEFNLYFERFLNPERISMPDIDMDFPDNKRDDVIRYVVEKYGIDKVASIITFGTFQGKSAIRDVGRIIGTSSVIIDDLSKKVSLSNNSIEEFESNHPKDFKYYMNNPDINRLVSIAKKLSGLVRHVSTHAAGIIISNDPILSYSPVQPGLLDMYQTQYEASDLESLGLLKIDFLGIRNLTIIDDVVKLVDKYEGKKINVYKIPLDDKATFDLLKQVKTLGIFQLESEGMMNLIRQMQLDVFEDIATCISLHRPGPMENIPTYIKRRNKEEMIDYLDKDLIPILKPTYGIIVYQEQIMKIANKFAGYSLGEADVLRRAVSKKIESILIKERKKFVDGVIQEGYTEHFGQSIYDYIVKFANYGFNKSHAVAYSYVAYWMAYLKANYPSYFLAVLLDSQIGSITGTKKYIRECKSMGINVLPPKINLSDVSYRYENNDLRYPFMAIKGIGMKMAETIIEVQNEAQVTSFIDFYARGKHLPKNVINTLIRANVFSEFNINQRTLVENLDRVEAFISFHYNDESFNYVEYEEYDYELMEAKERELLGVNFEYHLIHKYQKMIKLKNYPLLSEVIEKPLGSLAFVGVVSQIKIITTKNNKEMAFITLEDDMQEIDGVLFPDQYERYKEVLNENKAFMFFGVTEMRRGRKQVLINKIKSLTG